jgi:hypothetical protein
MAQACGRRRELGAPWGILRLKMRVISLTFDRRTGPPSVNLLAGGS